MSTPRLLTLRMKARSVAQEAGHNTPALPEDLRALQFDYICVGTVHDVLISDVDMSCQAHT